MVPGSNAACQSFSSNSLPRGIQCTDLAVTLIRMCTQTVFCMMYCKQCDPGLSHSHSARTSHKIQYFSRQARRQNNVRTHRHVRKKHARDIDRRPFFVWLPWLVYWQFERCFSVSQVSALTNIEPYVLFLQDELTAHFSFRWSRVSSFLSRYPLPSSERRGFFENFRFAPTHFDTDHKDAVRKTMDANKRKTNVETSVVRKWRNSTRPEEMIFLESALASPLLRNSRFCF